MTKKIYILFIATLLFVFNCESNTNYDKVVFSVENKKLIINDGKKEIKFDFDNNIDDIIKSYKAKNTLSGNNFDMFTVKPYPFEFSKIYKDEKDKALDIAIFFDIEKGKDTGEEKLNKYAEEYKEILFKIKYDNNYLEINNKMNLNDLIIQLEKNNIKYSFGKEWLNTDDTRINIYFDKDSKKINRVFYFFKKKIKHEEQKIVN